MTYTTLLIDLDETVYDPASGVWDAIRLRMEQYMHERLGLPLEEIPALRRTLFLQYGTTLRGLQITRHVDERDYLDFVHDVPVADLLKPNPELREVLLRYTQRKIIFTNADRNHAQRVVQQLGLTGCFDGIIDIYDIAPACKPMPAAYTTALRLAGEADPARCVFVDDSPRNLAGARDAGIFTVQIGEANTGLSHPDSPAHVVIPRLADLPTIIPPER